MTLQRRRLSRVEVARGVPCARMERRYGTPGANVGVPVVACVYDEALGSTG